MAAPFFCTPQSLQSDLQTLGYPHAGDPASVHPAGDPRLSTLTWLAGQVDPSFTPSTPDALAAFWDRLGVHSSAPNSAGLRVPFTAPRDRPRDKAAASVFLRAAIDLAFAFRRLRPDGRAPEWMDDAYDDEGKPPVSDSDADASAQLHELITQRHVLFPATTRLLDAAPKKRPLQRKRVNSNKQIRAASKAGPPEKSGESGNVSTREQVLERLRAVQRQANDLGAELADTDSAHAHTEIGPDTADDDSDEIVNLDKRDVANLATDARALCRLVSNFDEFATERIASRSARNDLASRDTETERTMNDLSGECRALEEGVRQNLLEIRKAKAALDKLSRCRPVNEGLPQSALVQEVARQRQRTERHL